MLGREHGVVNRSVEHEHGGVSRTDWIRRGLALVGGLVAGEALAGVLWTSSSCRPISMRTRSRRGS
jgi:hypothetical protein